MKWATLVLIALPLLASASWEDVRLVNQVPENCTFVKQQTCNTKRRNGLARCEKWHKAQADKLKANTVAIITASSQNNSGGVVVGTTFVQGQSAHMTADYYVCQ